MDLSQVLFILGGAWFLLGIIFFSWLRITRLKRFIKKSVMFGKEVIIVIAQSAVLLAPFLIPIIVTILCMLF